MASIEARLAHAEISAAERSELTSLYDAFSRVLANSARDASESASGRRDALGSELRALIDDAAKMPVEQYVGRMRDIKSELDRLAPAQPPSSTLPPIPGAAGEGQDHEARAGQGRHRSSAVRVPMVEDQGVSTAPANLVSSPLVVSTVLICFYGLPFALILLAALFSLAFEGQIAEGFFLNLVRTLATDPGSYAGTIQIIMVPVAAALTAAAMRQLMAGRWAVRLLIVSLAGVAICIVDALLFSIGSPLAPPVKGLVSQFFISAAGVLAVYAMLLVGLEIAKATDLRSS